MFSYNTAYRALYLPNPLRELPLWHPVVPASARIVRSLELLICVFRGRSRLRLESGDSIVDIVIYSPIMAPKKSSAALRRKEQTVVSADLATAAFAIVLSNMTSRIGYKERVALGNTSKGLRAHLATQV